jgi:hypothetical protein
METLIVGSSPAFAKLCDTVPVPNLALASCLCTYGTYLGTGNVLELLLRSMFA